MTEKREQTGAGDGAHDVTTVKLFGQFCLLQNDTCDLEGEPITDEFKVRNRALNSHLLSVNILFKGSGKLAGRDNRLLT